MKKYIGPSDILAIITQSPTLQEGTSPGLENPRGKALQLLLVTQLCQPLQLLTSIKGVKGGRRVKHQLPHFPAPVAT